MLKKEPVPTIMAPDQGPLMYWLIRVKLFILIKFNSSFDLQLFNDNLKIKKVK